jgi:hypothetical protein
MCGYLPWEYIHPVHPPIAAGALLGSSSMLSIYSHSNYAHRKRGGRMISPPAYYFR